MILSTLILFILLAIATAAIEMLGGEHMMNSSRKPDIMADAAYAILTKNSRSYTGNFAIDEDVLREMGIKDFSQYDWVKGMELIMSYIFTSTINLN